MTLLKFHEVNATQGYAVQRVKDRFEVVFVERTTIDRVETFHVIGKSTSRGKLHSYPSVFIADYAIRNEILPLYKKREA